MATQQKAKQSNSTYMTAGNNANAVEIDLVALFYQLLANWKIILLTALIGAAGAWFYTVNFVTPQYQATSIIYVINKDSVINMSDLQVGTALTNDYVEVFKMWELQEQVIEELDLPYSYSYMTRHLSVSNSNNTRMLKISFTSSSPQEAAEVANAYARIGSQYIEDTMSTDKPNIMSAALIPGSPISPNKTRNVILGFLLGALLTAGIVTLVTVGDDKLKTAEEIRKYTGLATLAIVPIEDSISSDKNSNSAEKKENSAGRKK